jgi:hypothetical protein
MKLAKLKHFFAFQIIGYGLNQYKNDYDEHALLALSNHFASKVSLIKSTENVQKDSLFAQSRQDNTTQQIPYGVKMVFEDTIVPSLTLNELIAIGQSLGSEDVSVAGEGCDFQYDEFSGDHENSLIVHVWLQDVHKVLTQYERWHEKLIAWEEHKAHTKEQKKAKKKV